MSAPGFLNAACHIWLLRLLSGRISSAFTISAIWKRELEVRQLRQWRNCAENKCITERLVVIETVGCTIESQQSRFHYYFRWQLHVLVPHNGIILDPSYSSISSFTEWVENRHFHASLPFPIGTFSFAMTTTAIPFHMLRSVSQRIQHWSVIPYTYVP